jgi:hypothetical protein
MRGSSTLMRVRCSAWRPGAGRLAGVLLIGLSALGCLLDVPVDESGHGVPAFLAAEQTDAVGGPNVIAMSGNGGGHSGASCEHEAPLVLVGSPPLQTPISDASMSISQSNGAASPARTSSSARSRLLVPVPHLLCVLRT